MSSVTLREVFNALYDGCDGLLEFRALPSRSQAFVARTDRTAILSFLNGHAAEDCYLGVATRTDDSSGAAENCQALAVLFVDLDFKVTPEAEARQRLADFPLPPLLVVHSGGGLHVYFGLREPFDLQHPAERAEAGALVTRLAAALHADPSATDIARILRIPKTHNWKYDPPRPVVIEAFAPTARHNPSEFDAVLPALPEASAPRMGPYTVPDVAMIQPGERNATLFKLARALKAKKLPVSAILASLRGLNRTFTLPHDDAEVDRAFDSAMRQPDRKIQRPPDDPPPSPEPAPEPPVDPADVPPLPVLLDALVTYFRRFVVMADSQAHTAALWAAHTHTFETAESTPYLHITAPTKRAGKTRLLELLEGVVRRPWLTGRTTVAALTRKIDGEQPTLLLDESDRALTDGGDYAAALIGVLNSGYRPSGRATLCSGEGSKITVVDLATFCPKSFAGIGKLPDTVADRSITIRLRRRARTEPVERARQRQVRAAATPLRRALEGWATTAREILAGAEPALPDALNDRQSDVWEPLFALAHLAGGAWPDRVTVAALALSATDTDDDHGVMLLSDIRDVLDVVAITDPRGHAYDVIPSEALLAKLLTLKERPWCTWGKGDKGMTLHALARLLGTFDLRSAQHRLGEARYRGYRRISFDDAFARYLPGVPEPPIPPIPGSEARQRDTPNETGGLSQDSKRDSGGSCLASESVTYPMNTSISPAVSLCTPKNTGQHGVAHVAAPAHEGLVQLRADLEASGLVTPGTPLVEVPAQPWTPVRPEDFDPADVDLPPAQQEYRARARARARALAGSPTTEGGTDDDVAEPEPDPTQVFNFH